MPPIITEKQLLSLDSSKQHDYLVAVLVFIQQQDITSATDCPEWLFLLTIAYASDNTQGLEGTPLMSIYQELMLPRKVGPITQTKW